MFGTEKSQNTADPRIAQLLDSMEFKYEILENGNFKLTSSLDGDRSHIVFIRSETYEFSDVELRVIYSPAFHSFGSFDQRTANLLLQENMRAEIGAWSLMLDDEQNSIAVFLASVAAELTSEQLGHILFSVATTADEMEARLTGRDEY